jgi:cytochrome c oxidase cbb3-type subunit I/II
MTVRYDDRPARRFALAALCWGAVAMAAGLMAALGLLVPALGASPVGVAHLLPAHAHAAAFAFVGNLVFAGIYFSSQRMLGTRLASAKLASVHLWGWQAVVAAAALLGGAGVTAGSGATYSVAWPIDALAALVWLAFAWNFFATVARRNEARLYVALWFYAAGILAVLAALVVKLLAVPVGVGASYPLFGGALGAFLQAWSESGIESFLLVVLPLGLLTYLIPTTAGRPLFSYKLAIVHFWGLLLITGYGAPQRLLHTVIPDWLQAIGVSVGLLLWLPMLAGVVNGLATLRGAGARFLRDPVLKFAAAALVCFGLAALEAPLLGAGSVSLLTGFTDWMHGRSHLATMGGAGMAAAAMLYGLIPRLYRAPLRWPTAAHAHLYLAIVGLALYAGGTWLAGATQGAMLHSLDAAGGLRYEFAETAAALELPYLVRVAGGASYLAGFLLMAVNLVATMRIGEATDEEEAYVPSQARPSPVALRELFLGAPVLVAALTLALVVAAGTADILAAAGSLVLALMIAVAGGVAIGLGRRREPFHARLEQRALALSLLAALAALHGGVVQAGALALARPGQAVAQAPYSPLELAGREVYRREACASCHTQMIRPMLSEVARFGEVRAEVSPHDRPPLWGARRVGPDLARVGARHDAAELYRILVGDGGAASEASRMPSYAHLRQRRADVEGLSRRLRALAALGVPYERDAIERAAARAREEGAAIAGAVAPVGIELAPDSELTALLAYLSRLGRAEPPAGGVGEAGE